jgi:hypothetical protein
MLKSVKRIFITLGFAALLTTNALTLVSTSFNAMASGLIDALLGGVSSLTGQPAMKSVHAKNKAKLAAKDKTIKKHKATLKANRNAAKTVGRNITRRTTRLATTSLATIPAESVPWLGIAAVVTVTAYELKTACDNFKDLNQLYTDLGIEESVDPSALEVVCNPKVPELPELWSHAEEQAPTAPSSYQKFREDLGGTIHEAVNQAKANKEEFDDSLGGTISIVIERWGF